MKHKWVDMNSILGENRSWDMLEMHHTEGEQVKRIEMVKVK